MPYALKRLFIGNNEECEHFRKLSRTYNNNISFTLFAAKYDPKLTRNTRGVYTFHVQRQVYHFLNSLSQSDDRPCGIHLYFFDIDEELIRRVAASDKLRESTLKLLMDILSNNPYARFFKDLSDVPDLEKHSVVLNCFPGLDQCIYNLPSASQVAAIWTENDDESFDKQPHILVYSWSSIIMLVVILYNILSYFLVVNLDGTMELNESIKENELIIPLMKRLSLIPLLSMNHLNLWF